MRLKIFVSFFILSSFVFAQSPAKPDQSVPNKETILSKIGGDKGFKMTFEQESRYTFLKTPKISKGSLLYSPRRNFIWEIYGEQGGKVISNGKKTWIYTPAEEKEDKPTLIIKTGNYDGVESVIFDTDYDVSSLKTSSNGLKELRINGSKQKGYEWAVLRFKEEPVFAIDSFEFKDLNGTNTVIKVKTFTRLTKTVPAGTFNFKAPRGTRIIK
ncbi:MAG: outer membrane lipoprotein carrier protein LolA [Proteobacteria bacterium]|nr:outer membrane lipoprotein carrier protein LolA [Pseudomonadota bacterium]